MLSDQNIKEQRDQVSDRKFCVLLNQNIQEL